MTQFFSPKQSLRVNILTCVSSWQNSQVLRFMMVVLSMLFIMSTSFILNGCSSSGGSSSTTAATEDTETDPYAGSAKVAGTIKLSSLTSSDSAQLDSGAAKKRVSYKTKAIDTATEAVKLYVVGEDGELVDTEIVCSLTEDAEGDRSYECDGIKDGVNYIVRYIKITDSGSALELKASAYVPEGAVEPTEEVEVTPQTSVITEALVAAILSATSGSAIDDETVNDIIESVKTAIETLVESGAIQIPSMVVEIEEGSDLADIVGGEVENDKLDNTAGLLITDETVDTELGLIASDTEAALFDMSTVVTAEEKEAFIKKVFHDLLSDDKGESEDMPEVFFGFFTWLYVNNETVTAGGLLDAILGSITYDLDSLGAQIAINTDQVTTANLLTDLNANLDEMYALLAIDTASLTDQQKEDLADFPPIFRGLFPSTILPVTTTTALNPPQSIAMIVYMEEVFMPNTVVPAGDLSGTADSSGQINYDDRDIYDWEDEALFTFLGLPAYVTANPTLFTGIEIYGLYLHPGSVWVDNMEQEALMGGTELMNLAAFATGGDDELGGDSGATVTLTYPIAAGGTSTIAMEFITHEGDDYGYWGIDPWGESAGGEIDPTRVVSDFTSGTYTITVVYDGTTTTKSFEKKVITGMTDKYAKITTPKGMPNWPGESATQAEMEAFNTSWDLFYAGGGRTNFTANVMSDGTEPGEGETATNAKITVSWEAPEVTLPEGIKIVYDIDIGLSDCTDTNCSWTPIWNTWEDNKKIYTTSATIPYIFPIQPDTTNPYHLNIGVNFVNQATGEYLGRGGSAHTEFTVGQPLDLTNVFTIKGLNKITITDDSVTAANLRIALVNEVYNSTTSSSTQTIVRIADIIGENGYNLDLEIGDFLSGTSMNSWFNFVLVEDAADALSAGDSLGSQPTYWPNHSSGGMWFDTWGGVLKVGKDTCTSDGECVHEETVIVGDEIIDGPEFYIGQDAYQPPNPADITPVSNLSLPFTIGGNVQTTIDPPLTNPQVVLIEEGYDATLDMHVQTVVSIDTDVSGGTYSLSTTVGAFYDTAGLPNDKWFQIILVDAIDMETQSNATLAVGDVIGYMPMWWPNWSTGSFGFDTWRGGALWVYTETVDDVTGIWSKTETEVDTADMVVPGPDLSNAAYTGAVQDK